MKALKENRIFSFAVIFAVYLLAGALGIVVYGALDLNPWLALLIADMVATVFAFAFSVAFKNASVYDPYWSVQPIVIVYGFAAISPITPLGVLLLIAITVWGVRLTANWAYTFKSLAHQDWRYTMLCEKTGKAYPIINFVGIHTVPTLVVYGCTLPAVYALICAPKLNAASVVFICVSLLAVLLQGTADIQMHRYRKNRTEPFIRVGLWKYSRHPNYLGEILMWWGIALSVVCAMPQMWYLAFGALANTALFIFVSIPLADGRQAKKAGFDEYKAHTRALFPIKK